MTAFQTVALMTCERQQMRLTVAGCTRLWKSTQESKPAKHEGRYHCLSCPIGAAHNGISIPPTADAVEAIATICPRCNRRSDRLVSNPSARGTGVTQGLCISCYNREREVRVGRNSKGNPPTLTKRLHPAKIVAFDGGEAEVIESQAVVSLEEMMIARAKLATAITFFSRYEPGETAEAA